MDSRKTEVGGLELLLATEPVVLNPIQVRTLERLLNERWQPEAMKWYTRDYVHNFAMQEFGVPALLVRIDMAPMQADDEARIYEVDVSPAGLGMMGAMNIDLRAIAESLQGLGVNELGYATAPSRVKLKTDHELGVEALARHGIAMRPIDIAHPNGYDGPVYLRAGQEDIKIISHLLPRAILLSYHGGGHKMYLLDIAEARLLSDCSDEGLLRLFRDEGIALKPVGGWGSRGVLVCARKPPYARAAATIDSFERELEFIHHRKAEAEYIVQAFAPPEYLKADRLFRNWRIFAVYTRDGYRIVAGAWNARNSLKLHGASDTIWGPILLAS